MKKWEMQSKFKVKNSKFKVEEIIKVLLENRGLTIKKEIEEFLHPKLEKVTAKSVGIDPKNLTTSLKRIQKAIVEKEKIIVFGDYDVDGICGAAILWETLSSMGANAMPYIPHRIDEGYGLSIKGIENLQLLYPDIKLIITVDNGIVANDAVYFANKNGIDVIITDHHVQSKKLPSAHAIVHTTKVCGAAVGYLFAQEILSYCHPERSEGSQRKNRDSSASPQNDRGGDTHLELVALATVADLVPLQGASRTLLIHGLKELRETKRPGLLELFKEAIIEPSVIGVYEIGHIIAPRLNASGRLESAMDSLRLLCTNNKKRAEDLAFQLGGVNRERQKITFETALHAVSGIRNQALGTRKILFVQDKNYQPGVIGLVAGRLVEEFYRPAIVLSIGETHAKASARSIKGFNIIEFIRTASHLLVDAGGHPMAAGFTVEISKIIEVQKHLEEKAEELLTDDMFERTLKIDLELPLNIVSDELYFHVQKLSPFGMGNSEPTFVSRGVQIEDIKTVGKESKHLKLRLVCHPEPIRQAQGEGSSLTRDSSAAPQNDKIIDGIGFGLGEKTKEIKKGDKVDIVYTIDENVWNGNRNLQLKIKDIKHYNS